MKKLKVLVVEDDLYVRLALINALKTLSYVEEIDETSDGIEAIDLYRNIGHNVIFLDIKITSLSGLEVAKYVSDYKSSKINLSSPFIIFATGYNNYMTESYELYAYDYLLKPFKFERIKHTMDRIYSIYTDYINVSKIGIKISNDICFINPNDILFATKEGHDTVINTVWQEQIKTTETLETLEQHLSGYSHQFMRTHKGFIVNMLRVSYIQKINTKVYNVFFRNTSKLAMMTVKKKKEFDLMTGIGQKKISFLNKIFASNNSME